MSEENEVPSDEQVARSIIYKDDFFKQYSEIVPEVGERLERYVFDIRDALSALRASWEKEKSMLLSSLAEHTDVDGFIKNHHNPIVSQKNQEIQTLEAEKKGLEERVRELEGAFRSANYSAQTFENECTRLKAKVAELTAELQATRKACDQAHQNTLDREEERDRLKAENVELRKTEDAVLGWTHPNFKWYADKIDTLTCALAEERDALDKLVCALEDSGSEEPDDHSPGEVNRCLNEAQKALSNPTSQRASEEMNGLRKVVEVAKSMVKDFNAEIAWDLKDLREALESYESRGGKS